MFIVSDIGMKDKHKMVWQSLLSPGGHTLKPTDALNRTVHIVLFPTDAYP